MWTQGIDMFSEKALELIKMMREKPIQITNIQTDKPASGSVQRFQVCQVPPLNQTLGESTRFIVPVDVDYKVKPPELTFNGYFLPYADNKMTSMILADDVDVFVTPPLSGCSFIATETEIERAGHKEKQIKVYHLNATENGMTSEAGIKSMVKRIPPNEQIIFELHKPQYVQWDPDRPVSLIGLRNGEHWSFHYQIQSADDDLYYESSMTHEEKTSVLREEMRGLRGKGDSIIEPVNANDSSEEVDDDKPQSFGY